MKLTIFLVAFFFIQISLIGQKHDNNWLLGLNTNSTDSGYGTALVNFDHGFQIDSFNSPINFQETILTMSDSLGSLLFFSNGTKIYNSSGELIENGDSLNFQSKFFKYSLHVGMNFKQSMLCLPHPNEKDTYTLFHYEYTSELGAGTYPNKLLATTIDMSQNSNKGTVVEKNNLILKGKFSGLAATRHGNGEDWWIVMPKDTGGLYYTVLFDGQGIHPLDSQIVYNETVRTKIRNSGWNQFTPDGSKFINYYNYAGLRIIDFDRCTGTFFNPIKADLDPNIGNNLNTFPFNLWSAQLPGHGLSISQNGRFAYTSNYRWIIQYDLEADDIKESRTVVAEYDGFQSPWGTQFYSMQLMPDGKIYINCGNSENVMHVINQPDLEGVACDVQQHAVQLPVFNIRSMPYFPNYRLMDWEDSPCDTLGIDTPVSIIDIAQKEIERAKVFPNPTSGNVTIEFENVIEENYQFVLHNAIGQRVFINQLLKGQKEQQLTFPKLPSGIYYYGIGLDGGFVFRTGKLVLE